MRPSPLVQAALWTGLLCAGVAATRGWHPTLLVAVVATTTLLGAYAAAVYTTLGVLVPRLKSRGRRVPFWFALAGVCVVMTLVAVVAIQIEYDALWGEDARRLGFWPNFALDLAGLLAHLAAAALLVRLIQERR